MYFCEDSVCLVDLPNSLHLVKQLFFLVVKADPGISEKLVTELGMTGVMSS